MDKQEIMTKIARLHEDCANVFNDRHMSTVEVLSGSVLLCVYLESILEELKILNSNLAGDKAVVPKGKKVKAAAVIPEADIPKEPEPIQVPPQKAFVLSPENVKALFQKSIETRTVINERLIEVTSPFSVEKLIEMKFILPVRRHECSFNNDLKMTANG
jgi:hypothetical protein